MILSRIYARFLSVFRFGLDAMHVLCISREATINLVIQSPQLSPPLRWLLGKRSVFELLSHLSRLFSDWIDVLAYRESIIQVDGQKMFAIRTPSYLINHSAGKPLHPDDGMLIYTEDYEPHVVSLFCSLLQEGMKVVDVGASLGYYTLLAAKRVGKGGEVSAFEPNPFRFKYLSKTVEMNGWENVRAYKAFLSDVDLPQKNTFTLDSFTNADVVKIDVEGMELKVLRGMEKSLSRGAEIVCEIHPKLFSAEDIGEIGGLLKRHGYESRLITDQGTVEVPNLFRDRRRHYHFTRKEENR